MLSTPRTPHLASGQVVPGHCQSVIVCGVRMANAGSVRGHDVQRPRTPHIENLALRSPDAGCAGSVSGLRAYGRACTQAQACARARADVCDPAHPALCDKRRENKALALRGQGQEHPARGAGSTVTERGRALRSHRRPVATGQHEHRLVSRGARENGRSARGWAEGRAQRCGAVSGAPRATARGGTVTMRLLDGFDGAMRTYVPVTRISVTGHPPRTVWERSGPNGLNFQRRLPPRFARALPKERYRWG